MEIIEVVENPRRKRRRLSRKQIAAGFGGKRRRRRRNPGLATYMTSANPRRRRRARVYGRRYRRRYRNPGMLGGLGNMVDLNGLLWMSAGAVGVKLVPRFVQQVWPGMPTTGITGKLVQAGLGFGLSMLAKQFVGQRAAQNVLNGALVVTLVEVLNENVLPMIGLSDYVYLTPAELEPALSGGGVSDYVYDMSAMPAPPVGAY